MKIAGHLYRINLHTKEAMFMKIKAFALIELLLATILGMLVMLGSVGLLENMQRESANFQRRVSEDMNWVEANQHLAQFVHSSSYLDINAGALVLYDYDGNPRGRYVNVPSADAVHPENGQLEYQAYNSAGGTYTTQSIFRSVNAAFAVPPSPQGRRDFRTIETIINYTQPFANTLYLRCMAYTRPGSGTFALFLPWGVGINSHIMGVKAVVRADNSPDGFILTGRKGGQSVIRLGNDGRYLWSKHYTSPRFQNGDLSFDNDTAQVIQVFKSGRIPDGFMVMSDFYPPCGGYEGVMVIKIDNNGKLEWMSPFTANASGYPWLRSKSVKQLFTANGDPDGYLISGQSYANHPFSACPISYLRRITTDGSTVWVKLFEEVKTSSLTGKLAAFNPARSMELTFNSTGGIDGCIVPGTQYCNGNYGYNKEKAMLMKIGSDGNEAWAANYLDTFPGGGAHSDVSSLEYTRGVFDDSGQDGFISAGYAYYNGNICPYLVLTAKDGAWVWSRIFKNFSNYLAAQWVDTTPDGGYIMSGASDPYYSDSMPYSTAWLMKTDSLGYRQWSKTYTYLWYGVPQGGWFDSADQVLNAAGEQDGYLLAFDGENTIYFPSHVQGSYIIKTDSNGDCPGLANPKVFNEAPDTILMADPSPNVSGIPYTTNAYAQDQTNTATAE